MSQRIKRIFAVMMVVVLSFGLISCAQQPPDVSETSSGTVLPDTSSSSDAATTSSTTSSTTTEGSSMSQTKTSVTTTTTKQNPNAVSALVKKNLSGMAAENTKELSQNPDRGYRMEIHLYLDQVASWYNWKKPSDTSGMVDAAYERIMFTKRKYVDDQDAKSDF